MKPSDYIKRGWCQGCNARTTKNEPCHPSDSDASQWCLVGAVLAAFPFDYGEQLIAWSRLRGIIPEYGKELTCWNDMKGRTQEEVYTVLKSIGY